MLSLSARRAWIEILAYPDMIICTKSLSARRAWIEIFITQIKTVTGCVALRKESVDRNIPPIPTSQTSSWSLSARRAWIEMSICTTLRCLLVVALRKESVDRNLC